MYNTTLNDADNQTQATESTVTMTSEAYRPYDPDGSADMVTGTLYADTRHNDLVAPLIDGPRTPSFMRYPTSTMSDGGSIVRTVVTIGVVGLAGYGAYQLFFKK